MENQKHDTYLEKQEANRAKLFTKIKSIKKRIHTIGKDKNGYQFKYADGLEIRKEIEKQMENEKLLINAPKWKTNRHTDEISKYEKIGKEWQLSGTIVLSIVDLDTGYKEEYSVPGVETANSTMQAKGSAETYAMRHWLKELFSVEIERDDIEETKFINDKDGNPVAVIKKDLLVKLLDVIRKNCHNPNMTSEQNAGLMKKAIHSILKSFNKANDTEYEKISTIPNNDYEEMYKYCSAYRIPK